MNERIRLLAEQAEGTKKHVPAVWQFYDHELEKFAELIVQECIEVVLSSDPSPKMIAHEPYRTIMNNIVEHFGVEE